MAEPKVIAFVNPRAGDNKGETVMKILGKIIGDDNVVDILKGKGPNAGLERLVKESESDVRVIVAGGDGTFSWVASSVERENLTNVRLMIIPLGSGNDMSRALGWGKKYPGDSRIPDYVDWLRTCQPHTLDVWKLNAVEDPAKVQADVKNKVTSHSARPLMCNYLSLGADAYVELKFNQLRWRSPEKYKSRLGNFLAHMIVGAKYMVRPKKRKFFMADHIGLIEVDGKKVEVPDNLQALIILNIPSYGAGTQPWGFTGGDGASSDVLKDVRVNDMLVNDGNFEIIGLRGLPQYGWIKMFQATGVRVAQGQSLRIELKSDATPFQVDGEPWQQRGGSVTVEKGNPVGVAAGPDWKERSRKSAKFANFDTDGGTPAQSSDDVVKGSVVLQE